MSQYTTGLADVTSGSATVAGTGTLWVANATVGDLFMVRNINTHYEVATISNDTEIILNANWAGTTLTDQDYEIVRDFTPNNDFIEIHAGDKDWAFHLTKTIRDIDLLIGSALIYNIEDHTNETTINLVAADMNKIHICSTATLKCTVTLPSVGTDNIGQWVRIRKKGPGEVEVAASDSDTVMDTNTKVFNNYTGELASYIELYLETATHWGCGGLLGRWETKT